LDFREGLPGADIKNTGDESRPRFLTIESVMRRVKQETYVLIVCSPPNRPTSALAPIAITNSTIKLAYMRGMSKVE